MSFTAAAQGTVAVTGATGNLGRAIVDLFLARGAGVAALGRSLESLERAFGAPRAGLALVPGIDLADPDSFQRGFEATEASIGAPNVLVHTMGGFDGGRAAHEESIELWDEQYRINLRSAVQAAAAFVPAMVQGGWGRVLFVAAGAGWKAFAGYGAYAAAKAGLMRLTEAMSQELSAGGITVNALVPSIIDTPSNRVAMPDADYATWTTTEAIARAAWFLASPDAEGITGAAVPVTRRHRT